MITRKQHQDAHITVDEKSRQSSGFSKAYTKYNLLPRITEPPEVLGQPIWNFSQTKWKETNSSGIVIDQDKRSYYLDNTVTMVKGTPLSISVFVSNPANITNPSSLEGLTFVWKRNGIILDDLRFLNLSVLTYNAEDVGINLSGTYVCEVSNQYGTTASEPIRLVIIDLDKNTLFNKNLIQNGSGDAGVDNWVNRIGEFKSQELSDYYITTAFGSVSKKGPFKFSYDSRRQPFNTPEYGFLPAVIDNGASNKPYASFFPNLDSVQSSGYNLEDTINYRYLGMGPVVYGQDNSIEFSQDIRLDEYGVYIDGGAYGIEKCGYEFFHYLGTGILNYNWVINDKYVFNTRYPSSMDFSESISNIKIKQVVDTTINGFVDFLDINRNLLARKQFNGPGIKDISAVTNKEIHTRPLLGSSSMAIIPNRKINFTNLAKKLITPGARGTAEGTVIKSAEYFKLPLLRYPGMDGQYAPVGQESVPPVDDWNFNFDLGLPGKITLRLRSTMTNATVETIHDRLVAMEMMLDMYTYAVPWNFTLSNTNAQLKNCLALFMACITTIDSHTANFEKSNDDYNAVLDISNKFLELSVKHQIEDYTITIGEIYHDYFQTQLDTKMPFALSLIEEYETYKATPGLAPWQIDDKRFEVLNAIFEEVWRDYFTAISYINGDFRFRKLANLANVNGSSIAQKMFYTTRNGEDAFSFILQKLDLPWQAGHDRTEALKSSYFDKIIPIIKPSEATLNAGYLKLLRTDIKSENLRKIPFDIVTETEQGEMFFNNRDMTYSAYAKGAAAFFGSNFTGSIPRGTRILNVTYNFLIENTDIHKSPPDNWSSDQVALDDYAIYSTPRLGVIGSTMLIHPVRAYSTTFKQSLKVKDNNKLQQAVDQVKYVSPANLEVVYNTATDLNQNIIQTANKSIADYLGQLPEMTSYRIAVRSLAQSINNIKNMPPIYDRDMIKSQTNVDLKNYPFINSLIDWYTYLFSIRVNK